MLAKKIKVALGIVTRKPLTGPIEVSVDLTRSCGVDCLMCWYWSPLLKQSPSREWADQQIDYELFLKLLKDFEKLQVKRIVLGGQGDPFLYPQIMEAIEAAKEAGIEVCLITSGVYFNEKRIRKIFEVKVEHIDVSIQAATTESYRDIHPAQNNATFGRIKESLLLLARLKREFNQKIPTLTLIHVICNLNYQDTVKIVELARETGAERVGFKRIDVIPETKGLLLNNDQLTELRGLLTEAKEKAKKFGIKTSIDFYQQYIAQGVTTGVYTSSYYSQIPCYAGWLSSRILSDGSVIPCCGCYDVVLGNIHNSSFFTIWNSREYQEFREKSINIRKNPVLIRKCKCSSCIDFEFNLGIYRKLHPLKKGRVKNTANKG